MFVIIFHIQDNPGRVFFSDYNQRKAFYKDFGGNAVVLGSGSKYTNVVLHNSVLYWAKMDFPDGIAMTTNYDSDTNRLWNYESVDLFSTPRGLCIASILV